MNRSANVVGAVSRVPKDVTLFKMRDSSTSRRVLLVRDWLAQGASQPAKIPIPGVDHPVNDKRLSVCFGNNHTPLKILRGPTALIGRDNRLVC